MLLLAAVISLAAALTRPAAIITLPAGRRTIVLTIDVSRSMCSTDITPNRLEAAKTAAISFIEKQQAGTEIGIVAFSGFAELVQPPTTDQQALEAAINSLLVGRRTAIGSGILKALDAVSEVDENVAPSSTGDNSGPEVSPVPKGVYAPDIIVLLTDGASNTGPLPLDAAQQAADRGVRVYSIGFGTAQGGEFPYCGQQSVGSEPFDFFGGGGGQGFGGGGGPFPGGGGFQGGGNGLFRRGIDEVTLKQIADLTGARYYSAESAGELQQVFRELPTNLITKHETTELTVIFVAVAFALALLAMLLALRWHPVP
jgi:Ca-activated chloride channel family protein